MHFALRAINGMNTNSSNMCPIYYIKAYHWIQCWCLSYLCISQSVQWAQRQRDVSKQPFVYVLWAWDWRLAWNERKMRWAHYIVLKWRTKMHRIWLDYEQVDSFIAIYALCMNRIASHLCVYMSHDSQIEQSRSGQDLVAKESGDGEEGKRNWEEKQFLFI